MYIQIRCKVSVIPQQVTYKAVFGSEKKQVVKLHDTITLICLVSVFLDVAALKQSERSPKSLEMEDNEVAEILVQMRNDSREKPAKTAAKSGLPEGPRYVCMRDLIKEKENLRKKQKA